MSFTKNRNQAVLTLSTPELAKRIRIHALRMTSSGNSSHIASVLGMADILAVLYGHTLRYQAHDPQWSQRDRFILSKGHAGAGVYAALAEAGFFPVEKLKTHCQDGSDLSGHVSHHGIAGVELSTGSLGHGLSVAAGMALAGRRRNQNYRVFCILSDGECAEGSNWEAILFASHHHLSNLTAIVDYNKYQSIKSVAETLNLEPFADKWRSFGWAVKEIDGHDHAQLTNTLGAELSTTGQPTCVIAHTVKGKGVGVMEQDPVLWHYRSAQGAEFNAALKQLEAAPP